MHIYIFTYIHIYINTYAICGCLCFPCQNMSPRQINDVTNTCENVNKHIMVLCDVVRCCAISGCSNICDYNRHVCIMHPIGGADVACKGDFTNYWSRTGTPFNEPRHVDGAVMPVTVDDASAFMPMQDWSEVDLEMILDSGCYEHVIDAEDVPRYTVSDSLGSRRGQNIIFGSGERIPKGLEGVPYFVYLMVG